MWREEWGQTQPQHTLRAVMKERASKTLEEEEEETEIEMESVCNCDTQ